MVIFVDIDGTLADWRRRSKSAGKMPDANKNKKAFQLWLDLLQPPKRVLKDPPIKQVINTIKALNSKQNVIIYLTGREEHLRDATQQWLNKHNLPHGQLYMRPLKDRWKSPKLYKEQIMKSIIKPEDLVVVFDDDGSGDCSKMYQKNGWVHLKVII